RHRHHLSAGLSPADDRRAAQGGARGRGGQFVQSRSVLSAGGRHGALRRARLRHRRSKPIGQRISAMTQLKSGKPIEPKKEYFVAGWASVNEGTQGPPVWELVERYIAAEKTVRVVPNSSVKISGV